ncbi:MAG TPA: nucleoside 2-deoxyribosyltransferase [Hyphomicrobiaceae bacterium]|nr:nucleoside 2-deoxyribosyltransferase [Hyphomicrobiaceae bacterium]
MTRPRRPRIYLAGPEVFLPNARVVGAEKCRLATDAGLEGAFPLDAQLNLDTLPAGEQAQRISRANEDLMRSCDGLIANLTPFRGVSMDAGTAFEVGFMQALGRPLAGYTNVTAGYAERARAFRARGPAPLDGDRADLEIEDFGLAENLMIEVAILASGGRVVRRQVVPGMELTDTAGFAQCLADIARRFART